MSHGRPATDVAEAKSRVTPRGLVYRLIPEEADEEIGVVSMTDARDGQYNRGTAWLTTAAKKVLEVRAAVCRGDSTKSIDGRNVELVFRCEPRDELLEKRRSALDDCGSRVMSLDWVRSIRVRYE